MSMELTVSSFVPIPKFIVHLEVTVPVSANYYSINVLKNTLQELQCIRVDHTEINSVTK